MILHFPERQHRTLASQPSRRRSERRQGGSIQITKLAVMRTYHHRAELMLDPRELTNAEITAVSSGQANNITINESTTATPTTGSAALSIPNDVVGSTTFHFVLNEVREAVILSPARRAGQIADMCGCNRPRRPSYCL
jgi:hypothetical protein